VLARKRQFLRCAYAEDIAEFNWITSFSDGVRLRWASPTSQKPPQARQALLSRDLNASCLSKG